MPCEPHFAATAPSRPRNADNEPRLLEGWEQRHSACGAVIQSVVLCFGSCCSLSFSLWPVVRCFSPWSCVSVCASACGALLQSVVLCFSLCYSLSP